jgi:hypothetical protein
MSRWIVGLLGVVAVVAAAVYLRFTPTRAADARPMPSAEALAAAPAAEPPDRGGGAPPPSVAHAVVPATGPNPGVAPQAAAPPPSDVDASSAIAERDAQIAAVRASGRDPGLERASRGIAGAFGRLIAQREAPVKSEPFECYRAGCFVTVVERAPHTAEEVTSDILSSADLQTWGGTQIRSAPIVRPDGAVELTWFFLAEDDGGADPRR